MTDASNWHKENGFEYALFPAKTGKPESLIIFMHGVGCTADMNDSYLRSIQDKIPGADVISLQGPLKLDRGGYSWFPYGGPIVPQVKSWLSHVFNRLPVAEKVEAFAHDELTKRGLTEDNLAYIGSSMGALIALQAGLSGERPVAAIVSSGGTVPPFTKVKNKSNVFLQIGEFDEIFNDAPPPPAKGFLMQAFSRVAESISLRHEHSIQRLQKENVPLTEKTYPKQGHGLDHAAWKDGVDFIAKALSRKP